jgi:hypothetical protein
MAAHHWQPDSEAALLLEEEGAASAPSSGAPRLSLSPRNRMTQLAKRKLL